MPELTTAEQSELDQLLACLRDAGYVDIENHNDLRVGARIRHVGHQWPQAYEHGTGVILALTERPNSPWSRSWHARDIELIALWDQPRPFGSRLSQLAQYHVAWVAAGGRLAGRELDDRPT